MLINSRYFYSSVPSLITLLFYTRCEQLEKISTDEVKTPTVSGWIGVIGHMRATLRRKTQRLSVFYCFFFILDRLKICREQRSRAEENTLIFLPQFINSKLPERGEERPLGFKKCLSDQKHWFLPVWVSEKKPVLFCICSSET